MRRILSFFLAASFLISIARAIGFTDAIDIAHLDAAEDMVALNIMDCNDENAFSPAEPVTRAEMVKMTILILNGGRDPGLETSTPNAPIKLSFHDIEGSWYTNYVQYASELSVVSGTGNGDFDPEEMVTGAQGAKMLLVAMGYDPDEEAFVHSQDWASNVEACAREAGLFYGLTADAAHTFLNRDSAARLMQNAISAPLVRYEYQHTAADGAIVTIRMERAGKTLLSQKFGQDDRGTVHLS